MRSILVAVFIALVAPTLLVTHDADARRRRASAQPGPSPEVEVLIRRYAVVYKVPETLVRRIVREESGFRPGARNGPYWGLMQIRHDTARGVGYRGSASGLLDAETNLKYGVAYLANAWTVSGGSESRARSLYRGGYYYAAKRRGVLKRLIVVNN